MDEFEARLQVIDGLQGLNEPLGIKKLVTVCLSIESDANNILDLLLQELPRDSTKRRAIINVLVGLCSSASYLNAIATRYKEVIEKCTSSLRTDRPLVKTLKTLLKSCGENRIPDYPIFRRLLNEALGLTEEQQRDLQKRQLVLEQFERDRDSFRQIREADWTRPDDEPVTEELLQILDEYPTRDLLTFDMTMAKKNICKFCELSGFEYARNHSNELIERSRPRRYNTVIIFEDIFFDLKILIQERNTKLRYASQDLDKVINKVARELFFYDELKQFEQPHVAYYRQDDDGRDLAKYSFERDNLTLDLDKKTSIMDRKYYRERAFRYRLSSYLYDHPQNSKERMPIYLYKESRRYFNELDEIMANRISSIKKELERLSRDNRHYLYICINEHLSLSMALLWVLQVTPIFPSNRIFSTTKYGLGWVLEQISSLQDDRETIVVGCSREVKKACSKSQLKYIHCAEPIMLSRTLSSYHLGKDNSVI